MTWRLWYRFDGYRFHEYLLFLYVECYSRVFLTFTLKRESDLLGVGMRKKRKKASSTSTSNVRVEALRDKKKNEIRSPDRDP